MGIFLRTFAAVVAADAVDRHLRGRPVKYWYPDQRGFPRTGLPRAWVELPPPPTASELGRGRAWDLEHPERPG